MARFARHSLIWLTPEGWRDAIDATSPSLRVALDGWLANDWPAIVRRQDADATEEQVCAGIALPPDASGNKPRIGIRIPSVQVRRVEAALELARLIPRMPDAWRAPLSSLVRDAADQGIIFRVYGSAALQCLTGKPYMTASSDLDLLFHPATSAQLSAGLSLLANCAHAVPLDGEVVFPSGQAVSWKEWLQAQSRVLVKDRRAVRLMKMNDLLQTLEDAACTC